MRTELHFKLPEEEPELKVALKGAEYLSRLQDIDNYARRLKKHGNMPEEFEEKLEEIRYLVGDVWDH